MKPLKQSGGSFPLSYSYEVIIDKVKVQLVFHGAFNFSIQEIPFGTMTEPLEEG
jgi:hypothetical protein